MSLNGVLSASLSALKASEAGLRVASQNIANVNTPGYSRVDIQTAPRFVGGQGTGVDVSGLKRAADRYLAAASLNAESRLGAADGRAELLDRAQAAFGDPASDTSTFAYLERTFAALTAVSSDPTSTLQRSKVLTETKAMFGEFDRVAAEVNGLRAEANDRIADATSRVNAMLGQIYDLNKEIQVARVSGGDPTSAENLQDQIATRISELMDARFLPRPEGGLEVRTAQGDLLVGQLKSEVRFTRGASGQPTGVVELVDPTGQVRPIPLSDKSGMMGGLLDIRDNALPNIQGAVQGLAQVVADALNAAHNENTATPARTSLTGFAPTGFDPAAPLGFTGGVTIGLVSTTPGVGGGLLQRKVEIDFSAGSLSVDGGAPQTFSSFNDLNAALGAAGAGLSLTINAAGQTTLSAAGGLGVVMAQGTTTAAASDRGGKGFSHFFGLNDLVRQASGWKVVPAGPQELALARPTLSVANGQRALELNDSRGAAALAAARTQARSIPAYGGLQATTANITSYAATVGGFAGQLAAEATQAQDSAREFRTVAQERLDDAQRVNLDEELVKLTRFQQNYAAAAKVMQTAQDMIDILLSIK